MEPASLHAVGSRIAEVAIGVTPLTYFPTTHGDMSLKEWALHVISPP
jgi:hypothetical protein